MKQIYLAIVEVASEEDIVYEEIEVIVENKAAYSLFRRWDRFSRHKTSRNIDRKSCVIYKREETGQAVAYQPMLSITKEEKMKDVFPGKTKTSY